MESLLAPAATWAKSEFANVSLGDPRRTRRLVKMAASLALTPSGTLPAALSRSADLKGAYRLLKNPNVSFEEIVKPHWKRTAAECASGDFLLIEDTTTLDFTTHESTAGLGRIGNDSGRGLFLHSTLALRIESWSANEIPEVSLVGLLGQECWAREGPPKKGKETKAQRFKRARESERWARTIKRETPPEGAHWTFVADRESDIYEVFESCEKAGADFLIRASWPRKLIHETDSIFEAVAAQPPLGSFVVDLRARPGVPARLAQLELRARSVELRGPVRPGGRPRPFRLNVIEAREVGAPSGVEPIRWVLLTSWPCGDAKAVRRAVAAYARRWIIEEYHKALKTGAQVERSQLTTAAQLMALLGILSIVALRLLGTKLLAASRPDEPLKPGTFDKLSMQILEAEFGKPRNGWTHRTILVAIAKLGGFLARSGDGNPGWITIWRGWHRLSDMAAGVEIMRKLGSSG